MAKSILFIPLWVFISTPFKRLLFRIVFFLFAINLTLFAENVQQMTFRINGHEYKTDDIFTKEIKRIYDSNKATLSGKIRDQIKAKKPNMKDIDIGMPAISIEYYSGES